MSKIFFCSDTHFGHNREFIWKSRGFSSVDEMNKELVQRWNSVVSPEDTVYHLGDITLGDLNVGMQYLNMLNGHIHIIAGNHDTPTRIQRYKDEGYDVKYADLIHYNGYHFFLSHFPSLTSNLEKESLKQCTCNLFGHTHQKTNFYNDIPFMYHVGVDSHNGYPVEIEEIISDMKDKVKECLKYL